MEPLPSRSCQHWKRHWSFLDHRHGTSGVLWEKENMSNIVRTDYLAWSFSRPTEAVFDEGAHCLRPGVNATVAGVFYLDLGRRRPAPTLAVARPPIAGTHNKESGCIRDLVPFRFCSRVGYGAPFSWHGHKFVLFFFSTDSCRIWSALTMWWHNRKIGLHSDSLVFFVYGMLNTCCKISPFSFLSSYFWK